MRGRTFLLVATVVAGCSGDRQIGALLPPVLDAAPDIMDAPSGNDAMPADLAREVPAGDTGETQADLPSTEPRLTVTPRPLDLMRVPVMCLSSPGVFLDVRNEGSQDIGPLGVQLIDPATTFLMIDGCANTILQPQRSCPVLMFSRAPSAGLKVAMLKVEGQPLTAPVEATIIAEASSAVVGPRRVDFLQTMVGKPSRQSATFVNGTGDNVSLSPPFVKNDDFRIVSSTCGTGLLPCEACAITVEFGPRAPGKQDGVLLLPFGSTSVEVTLFATGVM